MENIGKILDSTTGKIKMEISITLSDFDFVLDINITTYPSHTPESLSFDPETGNFISADPAEYIEAEFDIESAVPAGFGKITFAEWNMMDEDEQGYYSDSLEKAAELEQNSYTDEDNDSILEAINEELKH